MAANRRDVLLRIRSEGIEETKGDVRTMRDELSSFGRTEATARIDVRTAGAEAQIQKVQQRLERLSRQEATPAVRISMARATEQLDRLELKLERLKHERVEVDVDVKRGALERTSALLGNVERRLSRAGGGVPFLGSFLSLPFTLGKIAVDAFSAALGAIPSILSALSSGFGVVTDTVRGLISGSTTISQVLGSIISGIVSLATQGAAAAVGIIAAAVALSFMASVAGSLLTIIVSLVGVLGALIASLAAAVGGLAALGVAFGAILGPAVLVVIGFMERFTAVLKARQAQQQQLAQATQQQKAAEQQLSAALDARKQAEQQLADATVAGRKAMAQAAQAEADAELGLRNARNGVQDARLSLALAKRDLRAFLQQAGAAGPTLNSLVKKFSNVDFDPSKAGRALGAIGGGSGIDPLTLRQKIQAVRDAQLGVANATNQVTHAEQGLSDARKQEVDFTRRGLDAYKPYVQALRAVEQANKRVAAAENQTSAAHRKYEQALKSLSPTERGFLGTLDTFLKRFTALAKVVSTPIFDGLSRAMRSLQSVFADSAVQNGLEGIGKAIGNFFAVLGRQLSSDRWRTAFRDFANGAASMIGSAGHAFGAVLEILRVIGETALPALLSIARRVAGGLENVAGKPGRIRSVVQGLIASFRTWAAIAGHVAGIVLGFLRAAKGTGDSLAGTILRLVSRWDRWINTRGGQAAVQRFLRNSVQHVRDLLAELPKVLEAFKRIADVVNAIAGVTKKIADFLKFNSGESTQTSVDAILADKRIVETETATLKKHLTAEQRTASRQRLAEALRDVEKHGGKLSPGALEILNRLKRLGFQQGGLVPGAGSGDRVPALLEPGEFVLRKAIVRQLSLPVVAALNGGAVPRLAPSPPATDSRSVTIHAPITVPGGGPPDPRTLAAKLERELRLAG